MAVKERIFRRKNCDKCMNSFHENKIVCGALNSYKPHNLIKENICYDIEHLNDCNFKIPVRTLEEILNE